MKTTTITNSKLFQSIITVCIFSAFGIAQNTISIEVGDGTIDVLYNSDADIGGFQFTVEGATVTGTSGTPGEVGTPNVKAPDPALTSNESA